MKSYSAARSVVTLPASISGRTARRASPAPMRTLEVFAAEHGWTPERTQSIAHAYARSFAGENVTPEDAFALLRGWAAFVEEVAAGRMNRGEAPPPRAKGPRAHVDCVLSTAYFYRLAPSGGWFGQARRPVLAVELASALKVAARLTGAEDLPLGNVAA